MMIFHLMTQLNTQKNLRILKLLKIKTEQTLAHLIKSKHIKEHLIKALGR